MITALLIEPSKSPVPYPLSGDKHTDYGQVFGTPYPAGVIVDNAVLLYKNDPSLPLNRTYAGQVYHGPMLLVGVNGKKPRTLQRHEIAYYMSQFHSQQPCPENKSAP